MRQPNKRQWVVIWVGLLLVALFWLPAVLSGNSNDEDVARAFIPLILVVCGLLIWKFSGDPVRKN